MNNIINLALNFAFFQYFAFFAQFAILQFCYWPEPIWSVLPDIIRILNRSIKLIN